MKHLQRSARVFPHSKSAHSALILLERSNNSNNDVNLISMKKAKSQSTIKVKHLFMHIHTFLNLEHVVVKSKVIKYGSTSER